MVCLFVQELATGVFGYMCRADSGRFFGRMFQLGVSIRESVFLGLTCIIVAEERICVCVCWFGDRINFACDHVCLGCAPVSQYEWCIDVKLFRCLCVVGIVVLNKYEAIFELPCVCVYV